MRYYVIDERMLSPSWFGGDRVPEIDARGRLLNNDFMPGQNVPPPGTKMVKVWRKSPGEANSTACAVPLEDFEENERRERAAQEAARAAEREREVLKEAVRVQIAKDFNAALEIPARWDPAFKVSVNACGRGYGSGARSNAVDHVLLREDLSIGRVKRKAGDLLCEASPEWVDDSDRKKVYPVTCKVCLRIAKRWKGASSLSRSSAPRSCPAAALSSSRTAWWSPTACSTISSPWTRTTLCIPTSTCIRTTPPISTRGAGRSANGG
ncbi:hypothetical protein WHZ77_06040 [Bradyrhizobium sp. A5]|uniref:hypothetical protein n=1 Tax=Bradyrhizobium sp. A5 TaxID=3133696 RepID=UPI00324B2B57